MDSEGGEDQSWRRRGRYQNHWTPNMEVEKAGFVDGDPGKGPWVTLDPEHELPDTGRSGDSVTVAAVGSWPATPASKAGPVTTVVPHPG